jgi:hypothetical protein
LRFDYPGHGQDDGQDHEDIERGWTHVLVMGGGAWVWTVPLIWS